MRIIGFDISSSTIGYGVLDIDIENKVVKYYDSGYFKPQKTGNILERLAATRLKISEILEKYQPEDIAIEDIIQFMAGKSTAKTIGMLTTFNRMIGLHCLDFIKKSPQLFSVVKIRNGLKIDVKLEKKDMPKIIEHHLKIKFPFEYKKRNKKTKEEKPKDENLDRADGIAVALYYALLLTNKLKKKK